MILCDILVESMHPTLPPTSLPLTPPKISKTLPLTSLPSTLLQVWLEEQRRGLEEVAKIQLEVWKRQRMVQSLIS